MELLSLVAKAWSIPLLRTAVLSVAAGLALSVALASIINWYGAQREERVRLEIDRQIQGAADAAQKGRFSVDDCWNLGGRWVQSYGRCELPRVHKPGP